MATLNRLIAAKKIPLPPLLEVGTVKVRLWSDADIDKVRVILSKIKNGRKSRYSKPQKKQPKKKATR
jgi:hypothetical protein